MKNLLAATVATLLALALAPLPGCDSGGEDKPSPDGVTTVDATAATDDQAEGPGTDIDLGDYPAGPYGVTAGEVAANHTFFDPEGGTELSFSDLRGGSKYLLLVTSGAGWCSACKQEAVELKAKYDEYGPQGLEIWSTLFQDFNGDPADEIFWNKWKAQLSPNYPLLIDADFVLSAYFNPDSAPMNMLIRLDTMEILFLATGFDPGAVEAEIKKFLE